MMLFSLIAVALCASTSLGQFAATPDPRLTETTTTKGTQGAKKGVAVRSFNRVHNHLSNVERVSVLKNSGNTISQKVSNNVQNNLDHVDVLIKQSPHYTSSALSRQLFAKLQQRLKALHRQEGAQSAKTNAAKGVAVDSFNRVRNSARNHVVVRVAGNHNNTLHQVIKNKVRNNLDHVHVVIKGPPPPPSKQLLQANATTAAKTTSGPSTLLSTVSPETVAEIFAVLLVILIIQMIIVVIIFWLYTHLRHTRHDLLAALDRLPAVQAKNERRLLEGTVTV